MITSRVFLRMEELKDISKRFRRFLSIDIEGLGEEEHAELLRCCSRILVIADEIEENLQRRNNENK